MSNFSNTLNFVQDNKLQVDGITKAFQVVITDNLDFLSEFHLAVKVLAGLFILFDASKKMIKSPLENGKIVGIEPKEILQYVILLFSIIFYQQLWLLIEQWIILLSNKLQLNFSAKYPPQLEILADVVSSSVALMIREQIQEVLGNGFASKWVPFFKELTSIVAPNKYAVTFSVMGIVMAVGNYLMIILAYAERGFALLILNFLAPFAFAVSVMEDWRKKAGQFMFISIATLIIFPLVSLGFAICDNIYINFNQFFQDIISPMCKADSEIMNKITDASTFVLDEFMTAMGWNVFWQFPLLLGCIFLKFRFMQLAQSLIWKILT